jgi:hypothetical protein
VNQALNLGANWREPEAGSINRLGFLKSSLESSLTLNETERSRRIVGKRAAVGKIK